MIIDSQLEKRADWEKHVGADIGGEAPDLFGWEQTGGWMRFHTQAVRKPSGKSADWLAALHRPILPTATQASYQLALSFDLMVDQFASRCAQAIEFDTRVSIGGYNYNFSAQLNYARGGLLQLSGQNGDWVDTPLFRGPLTPEIVYPVRLEYTLYPGNKVKSYYTGVVSIGSSALTAHATVLEAVVPPSPWADSCSLQIQQDLIPAGGDFSMYLRDIQYEWST